jgi:murein L,D-transpeptidase YcbB/YkuD
MKSNKKSLFASFPFFPIAILSLFIFACNDSHENVTKKEIVETPQEINVKAEDIIKGTLQDIINNDKELPDSFRFKNAGLLYSMYDEKSFQPMWSADGKFNRKADSLAALIDSAKLYGLFPDDYYYTRLIQLKNQLIRDTAKEKKLDASLWAYSDMMLSSAFVQLVKDIRIGRLLPDSIIQKDSTLTPEFFSGQLSNLSTITNDSFAKALEPVNKDYWKVKGALKEFLPNANFKEYTYVTTNDSSQLLSLVYKRLTEEDSIATETDAPDSSLLSKAIKKYQQRKKLKVDGKMSESLVNRLNNTDREKFVRIAINLDRYKQLPKLPEQYIWVNIPAYSLELREGDSIPVKSKVCVGKPVTKTPIITSAINNMITYPKWTIPESIVKKEILPGLKRDAGYTLRKGYSLVDKDGNEVDPYSVNWQKYKEGIPYKVVQGSGDDNALGVLKFNFPNKYMVYLHDTNQRYLFSRINRALSHGCVRVESWYDLAKFILRNDSLNSENAVPVDSLDTWLATKQKKYIPVRKPIPLYVRYFTCGVSDEGKLLFYEDVYGEDRRFREKLITQK